MTKKTKIFTLLSLIVLFLLMVIWLIMSLFFTVDTVEYEVLEKQASIEIRQYPSYLIAETVVDTDFKEAANKAFGRLFDYISGQNSKQKSIAMTAPVSQAKSSEKISMTVPVRMQQAAGQYAVSFLMPAEYTMETIPEPLDQRIIIKEIPAQKVAAIRYSGTWRQERYETKKAELESFMKTKGLIRAGEPVFARYNPPIQMWFLRRNEVLIPVEQLSNEIFDGEEVIMESKLYNFTMTDIDGNPVSLSQYHGKVILIVNVASKCGFTKQYAGLQTLYEKYQEQGLVILGFPANNFMSQEPGTDAEIKTFCTTRFDVTFPMFSKISVKGKDIHPLYSYLASPEENGQFAAEITWNFNKFLIDKTGQTINYFGSRVDPLDSEMIDAIEDALGGHQK